MIIGPSSINRLVRAVIAVLVLIASTVFATEFRALFDNFVRDSFIGLAAFAVFGILEVVTHLAKIRAHKKWSVLVMILLLFFKIAIALSLAVSSNEPLVRAQIELEELRKQYESELDDNFRARQHLIVHYREALQSLKCRYRLPLLPTELVPSSSCSAIEQRIKDLNYRDPPSFPSSVKDAREAIRALHAETLQVNVEAPLCNHPNSWHRLRTVPPPPDNRLLLSMRLFRWPLSETAVAILLYTVLILSLDLAVALLSSAFEFLAKGT